MTSKEQVASFLKAKNQQECNYTVISSANIYAKAFITSLLIVYITFLRFSWPASMGTIHIRVDSILILAPTTRLNAKTQPKLNTFDEWFLELKVVFGCQNNIK